MIRTNKWKLLLLAGDSFVVAAAVYISLYLRFNIFGQRFDSLGDPFRVFTGASTLTILPILLLLYFSDSYRAPRKPQPIKYISRLLLTLSIAPPVLATIFYLIPSYKMYRLAYIYSFILSTLFLLFWRLQFFKHIFPMLPRQKILILGAGATGELVAQTTQKHMVDFTTGIQ